MAAAQVLLATGLDADVAVHLPEETEPLHLHCRVLATMSTAVERCLEAHRGDDPTPALDALFAPHRAFVCRIVIAQCYGVRVDAKGHFRYGTAGRGPFVLSLFPDEFRDLVRACHRFAIGMPDWVRVDGDHRAFAVPGLSPATAQLRFTVHCKLDLPSAANLYNPEGGESRPVRMVRDRCGGFRLESEGVILLDRFFGGVGLVDEVRVTVSSSTGSPLLFINGLDETLAANPRHAACWPVEVPVARELDVLAACHVHVSRKLIQAAAPVWHSFNGSQ